MSVLYYLIGAPGSGKSTLADWLVRNYQVYVGCPDTMRVLHPDWPDSKIFEQVLDNLRDALLRGQPAVFDATNTIRVHRRSTMAVASDIGVPIIGIWVDTPLRVCLQRHAHRQRFGIRSTLPAAKLALMHQRLVDDPPRKDEGFYKFYRLTPGLPLRTIPPPLQ